MLYDKDGGGGETEYCEDVEGGREVSGGDVGLPGTQSVSGLSGSLESSEL